MPDVHAGHIRLNAFDMILLSYLVAFGGCCALFCFISTPPTRGYRR